MSSLRSSPCLTSPHRWLLSVRWPAPLHPRPWLLRLGLAPLPVPGARLAGRPDHWHWQAHPRARALLSRRHLLAMRRTGKIPHGDKGARLLRVLGASRCLSSKCKRRPPRAHFTHRELSFNFFTFNSHTKLSRGTLADSDDRLRAVAGRQKQESTR